MNIVKRRLTINIILVVAIVLVAIFAPLIATHNPNLATLKDALLQPSNDYIFGTDAMGRDLFSRVIYGTQTSLFSTLILVLSILFIGSLLGIVAGYSGGLVDSVIMRFADMMVSFPGMALAISLAGIMGASITNAMLAIMAVSWTKYARLARSLVLKVKEQDYIKASILSGSKTHKILIKYMLPSVMPTLIITAATDMGGMMLELAGFSFLGLGATSTSIEWGYMLNEGRGFIQSAPWLMLYPGIAIFITVIVFNLLGDSLRDILDPTLENQIPKKKNIFKRKMKEMVKK